MSSSNNNESKTKEFAMCGMFVALAMVFSYIESLIPIPYPVPGMRLGFANIVILSALYLYGAKDAFIINIIRIVLSSLLFGNFNSFLFSLFGGLGSLALMTLLKHLDILPIVVLSAVGGVVHKIVQIIVAVIILTTPAIGYLLPIFMIIGVVTGIMCGIVANIFIKHVKKIT